MAATDSQRTLLQFQYREAGLGQMEAPVIDNLSGLLPACPTGSARPSLTSSEVRLLQLLNPLATPFQRGEAVKELWRLAPLDRPLLDLIRSDRRSDPPSRATSE